MPVDFAASGVAALTVTGHKLGGPMGVGALLLGRDAECTPLLHGGGQERDVRSGTLDVAGIVGLAVAGRPPSSRREQRARAGRRAARRPGRAGSPPQVPDAQLNGDPLDDASRRSRPAARQRALLVPRLRGRRAAAAARRPGHRLLDRLGLLRRAWRSPATCCSRWAPTASAPAARCASRLGHTSTDADVDALARGDRAGASSGPAGPGWAER